MPPEEKKNLGREVVVALIPPLLLIIAVLGSILGGIATPTEAASVGAVGSILLIIVAVLVVPYLVHTSRKDRGR